MTEKTKKEPEKSENSNLQINGLSLKKPSSRLAFISLLLSLAALFAAAYSFKQAQVRDKSINHELYVTNKTISDLVDKQQEFKQAITQTDQTAKKHMEAFNKQLNEYKQSIRELSQGSRTSATKWQLKKAQFYLQLAQINAHWSQQSDTTVDLLKQADALLADQHHPDIYDVRQQISQDINTIEKQSKIDIVGLLTRINTIQNQIMKLSYRDDPLLSKDSKKETGQTSEKEHWRQNLANSVNALEKLVVIRHHKHPVKPILSEQQLSLVKEALYVDLQQLKWALIHRNQAVFNLAINQTISQLQRHFNRQQTLVSKAIKELESLEQTQLDQKTLVPSKALNLLNEHLQSSDGRKKGTNPPGGKH